MILPGYENPKTVCNACWNRLSIPQEALDLQNLEESHAELSIDEEFTLLAALATEFLAQDGYYYSWELVRHLIISGYEVYNQVLSFESPFSLSRLRQAPPSKRSKVYVIFVGTCGRDRSAKVVHLKAAQSSSKTSTTSSSAP